MEKETKEIIKLTTLEILNQLIDIAAIFEIGFTKSWKNKVNIMDYLEKRDVDRQNFSQKIYDLKKQGIIRKFYEKKDKYIEITEKGIEKLKQLTLENLKIEKPKRWDRKWRVVIFDIPEKYKVLRNLFRSKLYALGFIQVQKSVFVYPFECTKEVNLICNYYGGRDYIKFMIADIIEGEDSIINKFIKAKILLENDLKIDKENKIN